jgi:phosphatidylglycerophosphate synthase
MSSDVIPEWLALSGSAEVPIWGMDNRERVRRLACASKLAPPAGGKLTVNLAYVFDPLLMRLALENPGIAFAHGDQFVIGVDTPDAKVVDLATGPEFYNAQLRKLERPFAIPLTAATRAQAERASYAASYKGITDLLTKYLWPVLAFHMTRLAAALKMTPNMVTAIGAALCIWATVLFWQGHYWQGMAAGFVFMVLDTVDGKLARCTITASRWGDILDHGIDLVHPPFWWWAWAVGLDTWGLAYQAETFAWVMAAIVGGYAVQRLIEGAFIRLYGGIHIHVWRPFDSRFRLITARRNPNMVILFASLLFARPDLGLLAVAWWTVLSCAIHGVRLVQALAQVKAGKPITSWLTESPQ